MESLTVSPKEFGIEESKATLIEQSFMPKLVERDGLIAVYENLLTQEITKKTCEDAGTLRKKLVKIRTGIADIHKAEKAFYLASGRYVDALKNKHTLPIEQMEEKLSEIEKYFENQEKERIAKLAAERESALLVYEVENVSNLKVGEMSDEVWNSFLVGIKSNYEAKKKRERIAEEERIAKEKADQEERERVAKENERLRKEAEIQAAELAKERKRIQEQEEAKQRELAAAKAEADRILKEQQDKAAEEQRKIQAKLDEQRKETERLAKEEADRLAALKAEEDRKAKEAEKLAKAPIKKQLAAWVNGFSIELPSSELLNHDKALLIKDKFEAFKKWAQTEIDNI